MAIGCQQWYRNDADDGFHKEAAKRMKGLEFPYPALLTTLSLVSTTDGPRLMLRLRIRYDHTVRLLGSCATCTKFRRRHGDLKGGSLGSIGRGSF